MPDSNGALAARLRAGKPPLVGRNERGNFLVDLRTIAPEDDDEVIALLLGS
jgi:L-seryl-tRNA(Ser) seleniumtransferase